VQVAAEEHVPYAVQEAMVEVAGKALWYRAAFGRLLRRGGVPASLVNELLDSGISKYQVMRGVLEELDTRGKAGAKVQHQLIRELVSVQPKGEGVDPKTAAEAQSALRALAEEHGILERPRRHDPQAAKKAEVERRRQAALQNRRKDGDQRAKLSALYQEYCGLITDTSDKQGRGYRLEEMLGEVAALDEKLGYVGPYRKGTVSQTDGMLTHQGFHYLIEARWRMDPADVQALGAFSAKVSRVLQSTRGLFISVVGFRPEVIEEMQTGTKNLLLMTGQEFAFVLDGRIKLEKALRLKVEEGAKKGLIFFDLAQVV
jgi:hypothetical protein